jgi:thiol:disulfide interchange protein DsbA
MTLTRRDFSTRLLGAGIGGSLLAPAARAQVAAEGINYVRLSQPLPAAAPGTIEVIEFFWYECPHCNAFEPALEAWSKRLPADVTLRRVPVWFREEPFTAQQRLYYALESLGLVATLHRRIFYAIHNDHTRLRSPEDISAFMLKNGVDPVKFMATYGSFAVQTKAQQARQIAAAYKIDAVPAMGVQGRYYTNGSLANASGESNSPAGSNDRMLGVVDALIAKVRTTGA